MLDPEWGPGVIASAYMVGNQGNPSLAVRRLLALSRCLLPPLPRTPFELRRRFVGQLVAADLRSSELHEMQHVIDRLETELLPRAERERRAFLRELELAPDLAQYARLAVIATGGDPASSSDVYELVNYELLVDLLRALLADPELAPVIDRSRNLQAQLHLLDPASLGRAAKALRVASEQGGGR